MAQSTQTSRPSDEAVRAKTGKDWTEWFAALDAAGAAQMSHKQIVAHLAANHEIDSWWQQSVTVVYEKARGLRDEHQRPDGYQISGSKTVSVPLSRLFRAWANDGERARWLADAPLAIRKSTPEKSLRATWSEDDSRVDVNFYAKGEAKSQVSLQHSKLPTPEDAARRKEFWAERLEALKAQLES